MGAELKHFEIPARNPNAEVEFYTKVFDWTIESQPGPFADYRTIDTRTDGDVGGGIYKRKSDDQVVLNYFTVDDLDASADKITAAGGAVVEPRTAIKGIGYYGVFLDPEGNSFGLWVDDTSAE